MRLQRAPGAGSGHSHLLQLEGARGTSSQLDKYQELCETAPLMWGQGAGPLGLPNLFLAMSLL